jgi:DNA-binding NarL/FixJ family response regulator/tetratricopeptide (TPR) repeat protein
MGARMPELVFGDPTRLVGRVTELAAIAAVVSRVRDSGEPAAAVALGDAGIGKTKLLTEAAKATEGMRLFRMSGYEPEKRVPLGAATSVLRELSKHDESLARLLSENPREQNGLESVRVFDAAYRGLVSLAPAVLLVDDVQWVDEMSTAFVHYVMRAAQADGTALLALCFARPTPQATGLARSLSKVFADDAAAYVEVTLGALTKEEGVELARTVASDLDETQATELWATSGGSPFWIKTAARARVVPEFPAAVIASSLRQLSSDAAAALGALVIAGRPAAKEELCFALDWPPERLANALAELANCGLGVVTDAGARTAHDLVRDAALAQLPAARASALHASFADMLHRRAHGDLQLLTEALEHADAAGSTNTDLALEIARSPQRRLLGSAGLGRLGGLAQRPTTDTAASCALDIELAELAEELGDEEEACDRWAALAESLPTNAERATAAVKAARHAFELDRSAQLASLLDRARREAPSDAWVEVAADALTYHRLAWLDHESAAAQPHAERAITRGRALVAAAGSIDALSRTAQLAYVEAVDAERVTKLMADDIVGMLAVSDEMVEATRGMGERHVDAKLFTNNALRFLNRWAESETRTKDAIRDAARQIYPGMVAYGTYELALTVFMQGRITEAAELYDQARRLGTRIEKAVEISDTWLASLGPGIEASRTDWRSAAQELRQDAAREPNPHIRLMTRQRLATCLARFAPEQARTEAVEVLVAADADAVAADCVRCLWELRVVSIELYARVGELNRARELLAAWDASHPAPHPRASYMRQRSGAVVSAIAAAPDAADQLRTAVTAAVDAGLLLDQAWSLIDLGDLLSVSDRDEAIDAWSTAAALTSEVGAATEEALVRQRLREVGVRRPSAARSAGSSGGVSALSSRELEVARLAAGGARNGDIARSLFISSKTVEQHLSRIFAKLGVRNRTELGARFGAELATVSAPGAEN